MFFDISLNDTDILREPKNRWNPDLPLLNFCQILGLMSTYLIVLSRSRVTQAEKPQRHLKSLLLIINPRIRQKQTDEIIKTCGFFINQLIESYNLSDNNLEADP